MANVLKGDKLARLQWALAQGWSTRAAARHAGCAKQTAFRFVQAQGGRSAVCACGQRADHKGWCSWRYQQSEARQIFVRGWDRSHTKNPRRYAPRPNRRKRCVESATRVRRSRQPRPAKDVAPRYWPFIAGSPSDEHALLLAVNRAVPKWLPEQARADVCQDVVVAILGGATLTADLVREVLRQGRRKYRLRWDELSLGGYVGRSECQRWEDVLSFENPVQRYRPRAPFTQPTQKERRDYRPDFNFSRRKTPEEPVSKYLQEMDARRYKRVLKYLAQLNETKDTPEFHDAIARRIIQARDRRVLSHMADVLYRQKHRPQSEVRGSNSPNAKLTEDQVVAIRHLYKTGDYSQNKLSKMFGVSQPTIMQVVQGATWRAVGGPVHVVSEDDLLFRNLIREAKGLKPIPIQSLEVADEESLMLQAEFEKFWSLYPKRVAKLDAFKAYERARKIATESVILAGLKKYNMNLPSEPRYIAHAASWLNAGRWMDEYDAPPQTRATVAANVAAPQIDWFDECKAMHNSACGGQMRHHNRKLMDAQRAKEQAS